MGHLNFVTAAIGALAVSGVVLAAPVALAQTVMRVANVAPEDHPSGVILREVANRINDQKELKVKVEVFNGGVLGGELETLDQLTSGVIEGVVSQAISLYQIHSPEFGVEELPFLFPSREAAYKAVDGKFGEAIARRLEKYGYVVLAYWENGFRNFTNSKRPIVTPADMQGLRFRSAESPIRLDMFKALNASAIAMPFPELYAALQQGVVDGQENPLSIIWKASLYNVQKHISLSGHIWNSAPVVVSKTWWDKLDEPSRNAIKQAFWEARVKQRELIAAGDAELVDEMRKAGVNFTEPDKSAFQLQTEIVWKNWAPKIGDELMTLAREIRGSNSN